jgi:hypothetical protein
VRGRVVPEDQPENERLARGVSGAVPRDLRRVQARHARSQLERAMPPGPAVLVDDALPYQFGDPDPRREHRYRRRAEPRGADAELLRHGEGPRHVHVGDQPADPFASRRASGADPPDELLQLGRHDLRERVGEPTEVRPAFAVAKAVWNGHRLDPAEVAVSGGQGA